MNAFYIREAIVSVAVLVGFAVLVGSIARCSS